MDKQQNVRHGLRNVALGALGQVERLGKSALIHKASQVLLPFVLSGSAILPGATPFALAYAASRRDSGDAVPAALGAVLGYSLLYGWQGLHYTAAVIVTLACLLVLHRPERRSGPLTLSLCASLALLLTKLAVVWGGGLRASLLLLCEAALCFCAVYLFSHAGQEREDTPDELALAGKIALLIALLLAFEPLRLFGVIAPARAFAVLLVMLFTYYGGAAQGACGGVAAGAAVDLSGGLSPFFAATYGFSALLAGLCRPRSRTAFACCYIASNAVATLWAMGDVRAMPGLYECFFASVFFTLMPEELCARAAAYCQRPAASHDRPERHRSYATQRLRSVSAAIGELSAAMAGFLEQRHAINDGDISTAFDRAADLVCRKCAMGPVCWDRDLQSTHDALNNITGTLRQKNHVTPEDFSGHFASRCVNIRMLCGAINDEYAALLRRRAQSSRAAATRKLMREQYDGLCGVLSDVAGSLNEYPEYYPALESRIQNIVAAYSPAAAASVYAEGGRMRVEIAAPGECDPALDQEALVKSLSLALSKRFTPPETVLTRAGHMVRLCERERFSAAVCCAVRSKQGEEVSGDSTMQVHTEDGRAVIMLSDGMGTGSGAAELSRSALRLIARFVKSGCSLVESTRAVLPVLAARFEQCGFVTLDLLEVNLFTGRCQLLKYGAAPSLVIKDGKPICLSSDAMPAGVEQLLAVPPEPLHFQLKDGDQVILVSDGMCESFDESGQKAVLSQSALPPAKLASFLMSRPMPEEGQDDRTAIVVRLSENKK